MITNVQGTCARKTPFPRLTDSSNIIDDGQPVKSHMDKDVFLFLPGFLPVDDVLEAHVAILEVLVEVLLQLKTKFQVFRCRVSWAFPFPVLLLVGWEQDLN